MKLIKEAKRLQELAGINEVKIIPFLVYRSESGGNFTWWLPKDKRDPNQIIHDIVNNEYFSQDDIEDGPYQRPWSHHGATIRSGDIDPSTSRDVNPNADIEFDRDEKGNYIFTYLDNMGDVEESGYIEGKDFIIINMKNIVPLMNAFEKKGGHGFLKYEFDSGYADYLEDNNGILKTNTPYWEKLVGIVGQNNIQDYSRYLKSLGIKIVGPIQGTPSTTTSSELSNTIDKISTDVIIKQAAEKAATQRSNRDKWNEKIDVTKTEYDVYEITINSTFTNTTDLSKEFLGGYNEKGESKERKLNPSIYLALVPKDESLENFVKDKKIPLVIYGPSKSGSRYIVEKAPLETVIYGRGNKEFKGKDKFDYIINYKKPNIKKVVEIERGRFDDLKELPFHVKT